MQKTVYWSVVLVLGAVLIGSGLLWYRSYERSEQAVVRAGTPAVMVFTTDRGRLGLLTLGDPGVGEPFVFRLRTNPTPAAGAPTLEAHCADHGLGFGLGPAVAMRGAEEPALAGFLPAGDFSLTARRVVVPFWFFVAASFALLGIWVMTVGVRLHRTDHGLCPRCSYDITQCSHFCPGCGKPIARKTWSGESRPRRQAVGV
ncbi:MAG: hypothetical protein AAF800_14015 [Planctomycetota bacterium]